MGNATVFAFCSNIVFANSFSVYKFNVSKLSIIFYLKAFSYGFFLKRSIFFHFSDDCSMFFINLQNKCIFLTVSFGIHFSSD
jgi:hypothetical protein